MSKLGLVTTRRLSRFWTKGILPIKNSLQSHMDSTSIHVTTDEKESWSEKEVFFINITGTNGTYSADKTYDEILEAYNKGKFLIVKERSFLYYFSFYGADDGFYFSYNTGSFVNVLTLSSSTKVWTETVFNAVPLYSETNKGNILVASSYDGENYTEWISPESLGLKPTTSTTTLVASSWNSSAKTYSLESSYPNADYDIEIDFDYDSGTTEQYEAYCGAQLGGSASSNVLKAMGEVPTIDIPVVVYAISKNWGDV